MKLHTETNKNYTLIRIKENLSIETIAPFEKFLNKHMDKSSNLLIDCSDLTFIDSSSIGIIVVYSIKAEKNSTIFALLNLNEEVIQMFKMSGVEKRIIMFKNLDDAINSLKLTN